MAAILCFDIETIPDVEGIRLLQGLPASMPAAEVAEMAFAARRDKTGRDFLPLHCHRVVAIACLMKEEVEKGSRYTLKCIGTAQDSESRIIQQFYKLVDRYTPQLVSWNGSGFDAQVLHYRGMIHGVSAPRYWDWGDDDRDFKWNNYLSRYHTRHLDLMDMLALYSARANAPLDELAKLCGFPGKMGMDGSQVWPAYQEGRIEEIRAYCETDVANTFLLYQRFMLMRGVFDQEKYQAEMDELRATISRLPGEHWKQYLAAWTPRVFD